MNISINITDNDFGFLVLDKEKTIFSSARDHRAIPFVCSGYDRSWKACYAARRLINQYPHHIMHTAYDAGSGYAEGEYSTTEVSNEKPEDFFANYYTKILKDITRRLRQPTAEEKDLYHKSLTSFIVELTNTYNSSLKEGQAEAAKKIIALLKKFKQLLNEKFGGKMAEVDIQSLNQQINPQENEGGAGAGGLLGSDTRRMIVVSAEGGSVRRIKNKAVQELIEDYAGRACAAIEHFHDLFYTIECDGDFYYIDVFDLNMGNKEQILVVRVNKLLNVDNIIPLGELSNICPFHSLSFYQKYWKPIVDNIGHFYIEDVGSLLLTEKNELPDAPKSDRSCSLESWNVPSKQLSTVDISFRGKDKSWFFDKLCMNKVASVQSVSRYTEQEYLNAMVQCTDENLKSIYKEIGQVVQVIPLEDRVEVDVKFITFNKENQKIKKDTMGTAEEPMDGRVIRLDESQVKILNNNDLVGLNLGK